MFLNKQNSPTWKEIITYNAKIDFLNLLDACRALLLLSDIVCVLQIYYFPLMVYQTWPYSVSFCVEIYFLNVWPSEKKSSN